MYPERMLLYVRALTPLHAGVGRGYGAHVDLPVQRDEYGFPCVWSSSLKGAVKNWLPSDVRGCLGPDPTELERAEVKHSAVALTDARLVLIPARALSGVYTYLTSPHMLEQLRRYLEVLGHRAKGLDKELLEKVNAGTALVSTNRVLRDGRLLVNEMELKAEVVSDLVEKLGLGKVLPEEILGEVKSKGLAVVPDGDNLSLTLVNRSMLIQYRVALKRDSKTVGTGPWSEEFVPAETVFAALVLCGGAKVRRRTGEGFIECSKDVISKAIRETNVIFVGGKETIGRGLAKLYPHLPG